MMNKTILMLSVSCMSFIVGADLCYAGFNPYDTPSILSPAMLKSHVSTHTSHLTAGHLSSLKDFSESDNKLIQLAAACFVTDTTNCSGNEFAGNNADDDNGGVPPGGDDDYELDDDKRCIEEGYTMTSCPEGYEPVNFCPYDNTYFEKCKANCPSDYITCEPPYHGVGEACGDKYASCKCTPCGSGYDYTTIPEGYVQDGEACLDCDGKTKYKIKPNPCDGFMDCGAMGGEAGANTCQSGTETLYDNCKPCANECSMDSCPSPYTCKKEECSNKYCKNGCQSGYVWNASAQTCTCDPNKYKYTCTGDNETGGSGSSCDGKYQSCRCASGYVWKNGQCVCGASFEYTCTGANESPSGTSCGGKYQSCSCDDPYEWKYGNCVCSGKYTCTGPHEIPVGIPCEEKYDTCTCEEPYEWRGSKCICPSSYKYECTGSGMKGVGTPCNGKYEACTCESPQVWEVKYGEEICTCPSSYSLTCEDPNGCATPVGQACNGKYESCSCNCGITNCGVFYDSAPQPGGYIYSYSYGTFDSYSPYWRKQRCQAKLLVDPGLCGI